MQQMTFREVEELNRQGDYRRIPVCREIFSDITTPVEVLKKLMNVSRHCFLLESAEDEKQWGRYTFIGYDPKMEITCTGSRMTVRAGANIEMEVRHPGDYIRRVIEQNRAPKIPGMPPFIGGLAGYFSYDYIKYSEPTLDLDADDEEKFKDVDLMLFDKLIVFDNCRQKILLIANITTDDLKENYNRALLTLSEMERLIRNGRPKAVPDGRMTTDFTPLFDEKAYCGKVEEVKRHIREGDIFQLVLSNRLSAGFTGSLLNTYRMLRTTNPSPYMFYFSGADIEMAGASPETLVKLTDGKVLTFPLAGTRRRGKDAVEDAALEEELRSDEKEGAEHNMLVDLGRNDLGKICDFGSVHVTRHMDILRFSHVMHLGSTVEGNLRKDRTALDAIDAVLPAGTLSGAPKIRACQLINKLENNKRGVYGGAVGYLDFAGNMDTCIAIRLVFAKNGKVFVRSGAGIVADSDPESEYHECINKAKAVLEALESTGNLQKSERRGRE